MQYGIEAPYFLTRVTVGNSSNTEYLEQVTNVKSETLNLVHNPSARSVTVSGSAREPLSTCICPSIWTASAASGSWGHQAL